MTNGHESGGGATARWRPPACPARTLPPRIETVGPLIEDVKCVSIVEHANWVTFEQEILPSGVEWEGVELVHMPSTVRMLGRLARP